MLCQSIPNNSLLSTLVLRVESSCGLQRLAKVEKLIRRGFTPDAVAGRQNDLWPLIVLNHIHVGRSVIGRVRGVLLGLPLYPDRIEHLLKVVTGLCSRIVVLHHGELIADDATADVVNDPRVIEAYLGSRFAERQMVRHD